MGFTLCQSLARGIQTKKRLKIAFNVETNGTMLLR
jgi:hypothetical protein